MTSEPEDSPEEDKASPHERVNQKARTREAIVAAAVELAEQGKAPTVSDAANRARVGRTTAYRYFPTQEHLLYEAIFDTVPDDIEAALHSPDSPTEADARVATVINTLNGRVEAKEQAFRANLQRTLEAVAADPTADPTKNRIFGGRRKRWLSEALEPVRDQLDDEQWNRLINALALCLGVEPYIVLRDACGLDSGESNEVIHWVADTLVKAALEEAAS